MRLKKILNTKKTAIVDAWFEAVIETYPSDSRRFFKNQKDRFSNPVGNTTFDGLKAIYEEILQGMDRKTVTALLDPIIRIRAVQNFSPSNAVGIVFSLKGVIRKILKKDLRERQNLSDLLEFEAGIDELGLLAFDVYMQCRQNIFDLRTNEEKRTIYKAFKRAGLVTEIPDADPGLETTNINILTEVPDGK